MSLVVHVYAWYVCRCHNSASQFVPAWVGGTGGGEFRDPCSILFSPPPPPPPPPLAGTCSPNLSSLRDQLRQHKQQLYKVLHTIYMSTMPQLVQLFSFVSFLFVVSPVAKSAVLSHETAPGAVAVEESE